MASRLGIGRSPTVEGGVRALDHEGIVRLEDPTGNDIRTPSFFDPMWLHAHASDFDVFHVNFNFEYYDTRRLESVCDVLQRKESRSCSRHTIFEIQITRLRINRTSIFRCGCAGQAIS